MATEMTGRRQLDRKTAKAAEQLLLERRARLQEALRTVVSGRRTGESRRPADVAAWASETLDEEIELTLANRQSQQVVQIEAALDRLNRGKYGFCRDCEEFIGLPRLRALPFAQRCSTCQARAEILERRNGTRPELARIA
jgi:DnaK suppressor protein